MLEYAGSQDKNDMVTSFQKIDVVIYLHEMQFLEYKNGTCPFTLEITMIGGYLYDIKILSFEDVHKREFVSVPLWNSVYCESMRIG